MVIIVNTRRDGSFIRPKSGPALDIPAFLSDFQMMVGAKDAYDALFLNAVARGRRLAGNSLPASCIAAIVIEAVKTDPVTNLMDDAHIPA